MSKTVAVVAILAVLSALTVLRADARSLKAAAAYAPYNAEEEATETPAYKAEETYTGRGLFPGEAYAPNVPSLIEAAAMAPAPEGAYLLKLANQFAPGGAPTVDRLIAVAEKMPKAPAEAPKGMEAVEKAKKAAPALKNEARPALTPQAEALSPGNNPGAKVDSGALAPKPMKP